MRSNSHKREDGTLMLSILLFKRTLLPSVAGAWLISRLTVKSKTLKINILPR